MGLNNWFDRIRKGGDSSLQQGDKRVPTLFPLSSDIPGLDQFWCDLDEIIASGLPAAKLSKRVNSLIEAFYRKQERNYDFTDLQRRYFMDFLKGLRISLSHIGR